MHKNTKIVGGKSGKHIEDNDKERIKYVFIKRRYKAPFYSLVFILFIVYDYMTLKTGKLVLPHFTGVDQVINAMISGRVYLVECVKNWRILLFTGYLGGAVIGLLTGIACGYSRKISYWLVYNMAESLGIATAKIKVAPYYTIGKLDKKQEVKLGKTEKEKSRKR